METEQRWGRDERGLWIFALPDEVAEVLAVVPVEELRASFVALWAESPLPMPDVADDALRRRVVAEKVAAAALERRERLLTIAEAAPHLGVTARVLGYRVEQGELADVVVRRGGEVRLRFEVEPRRRYVLRGRCGLGPDPRLEELARTRRAGKGSR